MTTPSALVRESPCTPSETLPGTLADAITDAVGHPEDPPSRSSMICTLLGEVYDSVAWVHGSDAGPDELASLAQVLVAAHAHHRRMAELALRGAPSPTPEPGTFREDH